MCARCGMRPDVSRRVQEHVLPTIVRRHEAEAADLVEPLDRAVDVVGRPAFIAATEIAPGRTVPEGARRTVAEAAARGTAEVAARGTVAEATAATEATARRATEVTTRRTVTEATAAAEVAARRTVAEATAAAAEVTARRTVAEATARRATEVATGRTGAHATTLAALQLNDAGDETTALPVGADLADQLVTCVRRLDPGLGQGRGMEEDVAAVRSEHKAEALTAVVPFHLGRTGKNLVHSCV